MTNLPIRVHVEPNSLEIIAEMPDGSLQKMPRHVNQDLTVSCYNLANEINQRYSVMQVGVV